MAAEEVAIVVVGVQVDEDEDAVVEVADVVAGLPTKMFPLSHAFNMFNHLTLPLVCMALSWMCFRVWRVSWDPVTGIRLWDLIT